MYVSSCKSVDLRIDIVKYEEGFSFVVRIIKEGVSITNVSVKGRLQLNRKCNSCSTSFEP